MVPKHYIGGCGILLGGQSHLLLHPKIVAFLCITKELEVDVRNHQCSDNCTPDQLVLCKGKVSLTHEHAYQTSP